MKEIEKFLDTPYLRNSWLTVGDKGKRMEIFVRKGQRALPFPEESPVLAFDIANVIVRKEGQGIFTKFEKDVIPILRARGYECLYVENVLTDRFANHFARLPQWKRHPYYADPPCFYQLLAIDCTQGVDNLG